MYQILLILIFCSILISNSYAMIKVCWKATGQCLIVGGDNCNGYGFNGQASCVVLPPISVGQNGGQIQCFKNSNGVAYLIYNKEKIRIASDRLINDLKSNKLKINPSNYNSEKSSTKLIDEICKEYNIKVEIKENIGM